MFINRCTEETLAALCAACRFAQNESSWWISRATVAGGAGRTITIVRRRAYLRRPALGPLTLFVDEAGHAQHFRSTSSGTFAVAGTFGLISSESTPETAASIGSWGASEKGTNHETGKISRRGGVSDPLCRMRRGTRFRETADRAGPERCLQVRRSNVGTTRTTGAQASVRARTFLDSSRGSEHRKRVKISVQPFGLVAG